MESVNKIKKLKETINKEIPLAKELVSRRPALNEYLGARKFLA